MRFDLRRRLQFPEVVHTTLWPPLDICTVVNQVRPWDESCEWPAFRVARCGYFMWRSGLIHQIHLVFVLSSGTGQRSQKLAACRLMEEAEWASCWLWSRPEKKSWRPGADGQCLATSGECHGPEPKHLGKVVYHLMTSANGYSYL